MIWCHSVEVHCALYKVQLYSLDQRFTSNEPLCTGIVRPGVVWIPFGAAQVPTPTIPPRSVAPEASSFGGKASAVSLSLAIFVKCSCGALAPSCSVVYSTTSSTVATIPTIVSPQAKQLGIPRLALLPPTPQAVDQVPPEL